MSHWSDQLGSVGVANGCIIASGSARTTSPRAASRLVIARTSRTVRRFGSLTTYDPSVSLRTSFRSMPPEAPMAPALKLLPAARRITIWSVGGSTAATEEPGLPAAVTGATATSAAVSTNRCVSVRRPNKRPPGDSVACVASCTALSTARPTEGRSAGAGSASPQGTRPTASRSTRPKDTSKSRPVRPCARPRPDAFFEQPGAEPWAELTRAKLRASGETARKRDPNTVDSLTPQEQPTLRTSAGVHRIPPGGPLRRQGSLPRGLRRDLTRVGGAGFA